MKRKIFIVIAIITPIIIVLILLSIFMLNIWNRFTVSDVEMLLSYLDKKYDKNYEIMQVDAFGGRRRSR